MKSPRHLTRETYDRGAEAYAKKFNEIGARVDDVERIFSLASKVNPCVLEVGCGNGREAELILGKTSNYIGIDISEKLIEIARGRVPQARFEVADVTEYEFSNKLDIICGFASLLHVNKTELREFFLKAYQALNSEGLIYLSLKRANQYKEKLNEDGYGKRQFYYYSKGDLIESASDMYELIYYDEQDREEPWLTIIFRKKLNTT